VSVIEQLTQELGRLPGIGRKTSLRLVYHLMKGSKEDARRLARALDDVAERIRPCERCGNFSEHELCEICANPRRDGSMLCVVEEAYEVGAIERTGQYRGLYHVLGGRLSPLDGIGPGELNVEALVARLGSASHDGEIAKGGHEGDRGREGVEEVIVATNSSVEGEATAVYLENLIRPLGVRVTRLARGIPVGSDLEYVDGTTLAEALSGRREM
jgi:recombination protein RecR